MSDNDWNGYGPVARQFVGRRVVVGLPTNSIKLMVDPADHRHSYLWIDPPWDLFRGGERVVGSAEYPSHEEPDYLERHEAWGAVVRPLLTETVLTQVERLEDRSVQFAFSNGVSLTVGIMEPELGEPTWYDDWYARP